MTLPVKHQVDIQPHTTFGISTTVDQLVVVQSVADLKALIEQFDLASMPYLILGGGSNMLFTKPYNGLIIKNEIKGVEQVRQDDDHVWVKASGGEVWHDFVMTTIDMGLGGIENLSLIPGSVGAAPIQNIGAYGVELKDVFEELEAFDLTNGEIRVFRSDECEFGYRESVFKRALKGQFVITSVTFKLDKQHTFHTGYGIIEQELEAMGVKELSIGAISQAVINIRSSKLPDPNDIGNCGSFFKNPVISTSQVEKLQVQYPNMPTYAVDDLRTKVPAGWLIDQAGWKGFREGDFGVHSKQALVLVNHGSATGQQVFDLSDRIIKDIQEKFGITLEREVNIIEQD